MDKEIIVVDSQRLNMIQMCAYKYWLTFERGLTPPEKGEAIERGDLIHKMLQTYYTMRRWKNRWTQNKIGQTEIIKICERVGEHYAIKMNIDMQDVDDTFRVFTEYVDFYWSERLQPLAVEQVGSKILHEDEELVILYETKIDLIAELQNCKFLPIDHKSGKRRGPVHSLSNQFIGYCWMLNTRNLMVNKIGFQTSIKPKDKFQRHIMSYSLPVIESWRENAIYWIKYMSFLTKANKWPQNFTSCDKYSGCMFTPICESPAELRAYKAAQLFDIQDKPWDVGALL